MSKNDFLYAVGYNERVANSLLVYVTPYSYWKKHKDVAFEYDDDQYDVLYSMTEEVNIQQIMEGVYEPSDPYVEQDQLEYALECAGFIRNEEFVSYIEDTEFT